MFIRSESYKLCSGRAKNHDFREARSPPLRDAALAAARGNRERLSLLTYVSHVTTSSTFVLISHRVVACMPFLWSFVLLVGGLDS